MKDQVIYSRAEVRSSSPALDYFELTKPRITLLVVLTAAVGYFMASTRGLSAPGLIHTIIGTGLVAAGASVLNQVLERDADARMRRTANRAIPAGRVAPENALLFGAALGLGGVLYVALFLNLVTALLAAITLASYVFVYTPLKRKTSLNTIVGAVPGALPPLGGWAAARGEVSLPGWGLFLIVFLWQLPHFLAIAWLLREDYERGGFRMLPVDDPTGASTGRHIALSSLALVPICLTPTLFGLAGSVYFFGALALTAGYVALSLIMARRPSDATARWLFLGSIIYLPALLVMMMIDKLPG